MGFSIEDVDRVVAGWTLASAEDEYLAVDKCCGVSMIGSGKITVYFRVGPVHCFWMDGNLNVKNGVEWKGREEYWY
jgi:hypothetical protein